MPVQIPHIDGLHKCKVDLYQCNLILVMSTVANILNVDEASEATPVTYISPSISDTSQIAFTHLFWPIAKPSALKEIRWDSPCRCGEECAIAGALQQVLDS